MSLVQTLGKCCECLDHAHLANARRVSIPHPRVPLLKEGWGIVGTRGGPLQCLSLSFSYIAYTRIEIQV